MAGKAFETSPVKKLTHVKYGDTQIKVKTYAQDMFGAVLCERNSGVEALDASVHVGAFGCRWRPIVDALGHLQSLLLQLVVQ